MDGGRKGGVKKNGGSEEGERDAGAPERQFINMHVPYPVRVEEELPGPRARCPSAAPPARISEGYVTKCAPHKALKLIA